MGAGHDPTGEFGLQRPGRTRQMARSVCADCAGSDQVSVQNAGANLGRSSYASENDPAFYCRLAKFRRWQLRIIEISQDECRDLLGRVSIGRLACSLEDQPYVIPTCFVYESEHVYVFSTLGQKIKWMRQNPKVCLQVDQFEDRSNWTSVVLNGTFVELRDSDEREHARQQLGKFSDWWQMPLAERRELAGDLSIQPIFFRIDISSMTGLRGMSEAG